MISKVTHSCSDEVYYIFGYEPDGLVYTITVQKVEGCGFMDGTYYDTFFQGLPTLWNKVGIIDAFLKELENA